ncbi:Ig-like domain-containing protein [Aliivibrio fischeri]|uniref:Ig-like domain-containing protein n=1 Tax=Aliivibrio fischeri TaxID=668 RepID=UPI0018C658A9|nr:Ig-like domain-containing protein [Aliivibrio fischeri]
MNNKLVVAALSLCSLSANAAIENVSFIDNLNKEQNVQIRTDENIYISPKGTVNIAISAGLDRKFTVRTYRNDELLTTQHTEVINIQDLITENNSNFYGKYVSLGFGSDGVYKVEVDTVSLSGAVVNTESYIFTRDVTPPTSSNVKISSYGGYTNSFTPADTWYTGYYSANFLYAEDVEDALSGIDKVEMITYIVGDNLDNPTEYKRMILSYNTEELNARFNFSSQSTIWPNGDNGETLYGVVFEITDKAGNVTRTDFQKLYYDTVGATDLKLVGVYNPSSTNVIGGQVGYDPYVPGMTVHTNPIKIMYRIPKDKHSSIVRGGYHSVGSTTEIKDQTDGYIYPIFTRPYGFKNGNYVRFTDRRSWSIAGVSYNLVLDNSAPKEPVRVGRAEYLYSDIGWSSWSRWKIQTSELPIQILGSRQRVQPRDYDQIWSHAGYTCTIPAGAEYCETTHTPAWNLSLGTSGYHHGGSDVKNIAGDLYADGGWADVSWNDQYAPVFTNVEYDGKQIRANINQPKAGSWFDNLRLADVWLENESGQKLGAKRITFTRIGENYEAVWDLSSLAEGSYDISVAALENHGLKTIKSGVAKFTNDKTSPVLEFGYDEIGTIPDVIDDVRKISIKLKDDSEVFIKQAKLVSEVGDTNVILGYSLKSGEAGDKVYSLELPRLYPTLNEGEIYNLTVVGRDAYENTVESSIKFGFVPENLIKMETQTYLSVSTPLLTKSDRPIAKIWSEPLKLDDGRLATGVQVAEVTVNGSSAFGIVINDVLVQVGETKQVEIDLGVSGSALNLPIYPSENGKEGVAKVMFEIPSISSMYD